MTNQIEQSNQCKASFSTNKQKKNQYEASHLNGLYNQEQNFMLMHGHTFFHNDNRENLEKYSQITKIQATSSLNFQTFSKPKICDMYLLPNNPPLSNQQNAKI